MQAMKERHSVRSYEDKPLEADVVKHLQDKINLLNRESGLHMQLVLNEPKAFSGFMGRYGKFSGVKNYIAVIGKKGDDLQEKAGYYGEQLVLYAQTLGLGTCWVALTYSKVKNAYDIASDEKLAIVITIGYGATKGVPHKSKSVEEVSKSEGSMPSWFKNGVEAALLAPTAMNQQKFHFELNGNQVKALPGSGFYTRIDLGIARYHFELGAGKENFTWA